MNREDLKSFLGTHDILIAEGCLFSRNRLQKLLLSLGAVSEKIHHATNLSEAKSILSTKNIYIIFAEYFIENSNASELSKIFNESSIDSEKRIFIITTANGSKEFVVKSTNDDIDFYLLKPFSNDFFISSISDVISKKIKTSSYLELVEKGKKFLKHHQTNEAREVLKRAISLDPKPVLAHYYLGETDSLENKLNAAIKDYKTGLMYDGEHYKTLKSLLEVYNKTESFDDAYEIGKKLALTFPSTPEELEQLIRLTVRTKNFQDMTIFHELAKNADSKDLLLQNYIGSGLFVTGKYYLFHGMNDEALECFNKTVSTCPDFPKFVKGIIHTLLENELFPEAEMFIKYVQKSEKDYKICDFLIKRKKMTDTKKIIEMGMKILSETKDDYVLSVVLDDMEKSGKSQIEINNLRRIYSEKAS